MFLVSNEDMLIEAGKAGITGCVPALNYRTDEAFRKALDKIKEANTGPFGVNLIVNKSKHSAERTIGNVLGIPCKLHYYIAG